MRTDKNKSEEEKIDLWLTELNKADGDLNLIQNQPDFNKNEENMKDINTFRHIYETDTNTAWKKLYTRFEQDGLLPEEKRDKHFRIKKIMSIAAGFALLLTLSISAYFYFQNSENVFITASADISTGVKNIKLPDGTDVSLNIGAQIKYPESFSGDTRKIDLSGEAFFKVTKNDKVPFIIATENTEIKVVGTAFNVKADKSKTEVTVAEGHVQFYSVKKKTEKVDLLPGDAGLFQNNKLTASKNENPNFMAWKTKIFSITKNMNLARVVEDLNQVYQINIVISEPNIGKIVPSPTVFENYSVDSILQILCTQSNLKTINKGEKIVLTYDR